MEIFSTVSFHTWVDTFSGTTISTQAGFSVLRAMQA